MHKRLVLVGGGHTHALLVLSLAERPLPNTEVCLIAPESLTPYSAMLPGYLAGHYPVDAMQIDLIQLCQRAGVTFLQDRATGLDRLAKQVLFGASGRPSLAYDTLSFNVGSEPHRPDFGYGIKPMAEFLEKWPALARVSSLAIVGGGAGGVEVALSLKQRFGEALTLTLIHRGPRLLSGAHRAMQDYFADLCRQRDIILRLNEPMGETIARQSETALWTTHAKAPAFLSQTGLEQDPDGFLITTDQLLCRGHTDIFATGDCAKIIGQDRPRSGVFAVRLARPLRDNIERQLADRPLRSVRLQKHNLMLITTGDKQAVAIRGRLFWRSPWLWPLKDWIDRRFMAKFR